jgi:hypothetical protein
VVAALALVALQFHRWSKLSSGSVFAPEFPRPVVVLFNWTFGAIVLLALMQLVLDVGLLFGILIHGGIVSAPDGVRYGLAALALKSYARYYNETRTHLALDKDAPLSRTVKRAGRILGRPIPGGLQHEYVRV